MQGLGGFRSVEFCVACMTLNKDNSEQPQFETHVPVSMNQRPQLHEIWRLREEEALREKERKESEQRERPHAVLRRKHRSAAGDASAAPSLKDLLAQQKQRATEAVLYAQQVQSEKQYLRLLGRTEDLSSGSMDDVLAEARRLTKPPRNSDRRKSQYQLQM